MPAQPINKLPCPLSLLRQMRVLLCFLLVVFSVSALSPPVVNAQEAPRGLQVGFRNHFGILCEPGFKGSFGSGYHPFTETLKRAGRGFGSVPDGIDPPGAIPNGKEQGRAFALGGRISIHARGAWSLGDHREKQDHEGLLSVFGRKAGIGFGNSLGPIGSSVLNKALPEIHTAGIPAQGRLDPVRERSSLAFFQALWIYVPYIIFLGVTLFGAVGFLLFHNMRKNAKRLRRIAYTDSLTGARSLEKFRIDVQELLSGMTEPYAMLYLDIDRFKDINDSLGYEAGNQALCYIARLFEETLGEGNLFGRISADNFVALVREETPQYVGLLLTDIFEKAARFSLDHKEPYQLVLNCGIYRIRSEDRNVHTLIDRANAARKASKGGHSSGYAFYDDEMHRQIQQQKEIERTMTGALENCEFVVCLQPKYRLADRSIIGAEALVRWMHPEKGIISPCEFIPLFEKNGFVVSLDFYVFEAVCKQLGKWLAEGKQPVPISVNLSRLHLRNPHFAERFGGLIRRYRIPSELIEIELTETAAMDSLDDLLTIMRRLKENGFTIAMDDFGTGYSSLNLLKELPVDVLKLDRAFFTESQATEREKIIIKNIIIMAKQLDIQVISEGVETQSQVEFLKEVGCDMAQGFYFARPMSIRDFEALAFSRKPGQR